MEDFKAIEHKINLWAEDRKIFEQSGTAAQMMKLAEEYTELAKALDDGHVMEIEDGIGDMTVVLIIIAHMCGLTMTECLATAYNQIKDRKGTMVNGVFVKES